MKYILGLIFEYQHYKKASYLKIFTGDVLIDDIKLEDNIMNKCFLYEIDETALNDRIVVDITNDDNNYTNGFMTKFSYIKFQNIFLIPKEYFLNIKKLHDKVLLQQQTCKKKLKKNVIFFHYPSDLRLYDEKSDDNYLYDLFKCKRGDSFVFELPIKYVDGIHVFLPRNSPPEYIDRCEWVICPVFLSYYDKINLLNIYDEDQ